MSDEQKLIVNNDTTKQVFSALTAKIENLESITTDNFKPLLNEVQKDTGIKGKNLFMPIRLALTGEEHGAELGIIAYVLGKNEVIKRLKQ